MGIGLYVIGKSGDKAVCFHFSISSSQAMLLRQQTGRVVR